MVRVRTSLGGLVGEESDGVRIFRGVPFAAPPVGPARFRPARPPAAWTGDRDAREFARAAPQPIGRYGAAPVAVDEDCLYLNIHAPAEPGPHPVLVWVHGGGYTSGASFEGVYDGGRLARRGVLVVTVAYRLGALGLLQLRHLLGDEYAASSTNALLDVVRALRWVREHIAAFDGDPDRVTLGGFSAGAKLTANLLALPAARGLFHRAIVQSGGAHTVRTVPEAEQATGHVLAALGLGADRAAELIDVPSSDLLDAQEQAIGRGTARFVFRPVVDPAGPLPVTPLRAIRGDVPILLGSNQDEEQMFAVTEGTGAREPGPADLANLRRPDALAELVRTYAEMYPDLNGRSRRIRLLTAESYGIPTVRLAEAQLAAGGTAYMYRFRWAPRAHPQRLGSPHAIDIPFVFGTLDTPLGRWLTGGVPPAARELSDRIQQAWVAFVKGGPPVADGLPAWPRYDPTERRTMLLDVPATVVGDPDREERRVWDHAL
ncbi:carboxylesterase family protein [Embleya sp. NBC_00888]|uniref:carboxylesterase/lipase family protein n=1 Tax=Embleya sp. NBC_00888 TaxID=2975960 RepID=UPI00386E8BC1|nr:carboxylesterase family protein [Embleya sp. NBC_00888]